MSKLNFKLKFLYFSLYCSILAIIDFFNVVEYKDTMFLYCFYCSCYLFAIAFFLWLIYGKDKRKLPIVDVNSPDGLNPLEMSFFYHQNLHIADVAPLIMDLINRGYIKLYSKYMNAVNTNELGEMIKSKPIWCNRYIKKVKKYDGTNEIEKKILALLNKNLLAVNELDFLYMFKSKVNELVLDYENQLKNKYTIFPKLIDSLFKDIKFLFVLLFFVTICTSISDINNYIVQLIVSLPIILAIFLVEFLSKIIKYFLCRRKFKKYFSFSKITFFVLLLCFVLIKETILVYNTWYNIVLTSLILIQYITINVLHFNLIKWNKAGEVIANRILGFKEYLKKVEVNKVQFIMENSYEKFKELIPYMYIFDLKSNLFKGNNEYNSKIRYNNSELTKHLYILFSAIDKLEDIKS